MILAFVSRMFGFGFRDITNEEWIVIYRMRLNTCYKDKKVAVEVLKTNKNKALTENPFVKYFKFGANKEGYCSYNHMVIQLEDCVDCTRGIFRYQYDVRFLLNHRSGHAKKRTNGLDAGAMTK